MPARAERDGGFGIRDSGNEAPDHSQPPTPNSRLPVLASSIPPPIAARLDRMGLRGVADFLIDVGRPFGWLGAQLVLVAQPTLSLFGAHKATADVAAWLERLDEPGAGSREPGDKL